ncbi:hypothetical protein BDV59DRAFT_129705 [Aspergillus ambiguus]|uniref:uncharacterized protein n=1 Tax=Aspergillus ambiguus TaxID=176160 RepID=UPI003CCD3E6B
MQTSNPTSTSAAGLAQSAERETLNLKVAGSTPAFGLTFCKLYGSHGDLTVWFKNFFLGGGKGPRRCDWRCGTPPGSTRDGSSRRNLINISYI